jgi:hypothetical protein
VSGLLHVLSALPSSLDRRLAGSQNRSRRGCEQVNPGRDPNDGRPLRSPSFYKQLSLLCLSTVTDLIISRPSLIMYFCCCISNYSEHLKLDVWSSWNSSAECTSRIYETADTRHAPRPANSLLKYVLDVTVLLAIFLFIAVLYSCINRQRCNI